MGAESREGIEQQRRVPIALVFDLSVIRESYDDWLRDVAAEGDEEPPMTWEEWQTDWIDGCLSDLGGSFGAFTVERLNA